MYFSQFLLLTSVALVLYECTQIILGTFHYSEVPMKGFKKEETSAALKSEKLVHAMEKGSWFSIKLCLMG